jgi:hypothetical protein
MSKLFSKTDRSSQELNLRQNDQSRQFIQQQMNQGRQDLNQGFGGAYNMLSGSIPQQMQTFQQGNVAAQNYLLGGMPAFQASIMGGPMNYGQQFRPQPFIGQMPQMPNVPFPTQNQPVPYNQGGQ